MSAKFCPTCSVLEHVDFECTTCGGRGIVDVEDTPVNGSDGTAVPERTPLLRSIQHHLQQQDLQAVTDPNTSERLLTEVVGGHEEVFYAAVQRSLLMAAMLGERGVGISEEARDHVVGAMVGIWIEGFLTGAMVADDEEAQG